MKKVLVLLGLILMLSGCNTINVNDIDKIFDTFLSDSTKLVNNYSNGYKYYMPIGVKKIESNDYNDVLVYNGNKYYLYADMIGYYYKNDIDYNIRNDIYYSRKLDYNGKHGFIDIETISDTYKVVYYYNYAKIEAYIEDDLGQNLINMSYILNSLKFNDILTKATLDEESVGFNEEVFDFYTPRSEGNFIDYIKLYDDYGEKEDNNIGKEES